jgi:tetratricopeptide (TPR) repeat protein
MKLKSLTGKSTFLKLSICASFVCLLVAPVFAQSDYESERRRAAQLLDESKIQQALPIFEKLVQQRPNDPDAQFYLGFCLIARATDTTDPAARKQQRLLAREHLLRAKQLGMVDPLLDRLLAQIPPDGSEPVKFSKNAAAEAAMNEGEAAYTRGELDKAFAAYGRALQLDPRLYVAALFAGDMQFKRGHNSTDAGQRKTLFDSAGEWFRKAIAIEPDRETAYRYWGDCLLEYGRDDEARTEFVEAIVAEPYNRLAYSGIGNWANKNQQPIGHPHMEPPNSQTTEGGKTTLNVDPRTLTSGDGSNEWLLYDFTRTSWQKTEFLKNYPNEKAYRHSLKEEAAALRAVAEACATDVKSGKVKTLEASLQTLVKLNDAGLLEAFILFARPDQGIAMDYVAYRATNRDKLRRYWLEVAIIKG